MIKHLTILFFTSWMIFPIMAQPSVDSLLIILQYSEEDTTRLRILSELTDNLRNSDPDSAIYFAIQGYELA